MTKRFNAIVTALSACAMIAVMVSAMPNDNVISRENDTVIVNTQQLGKNIKGFRGNTPIKIFIRKNKVVKIETMPNHETPQFFGKAKTLLDQFNGQTVSKAVKMNVDGVSGATYSSEALKKNVKLGLEYYKKNK
ncbi:MULTISPECIES: FMN-binding protein [Prevotella]|uniref:FMN_bind domain-containing protein n=1 Tax=Prevotella herbatica TaxID=2801997 RepID=A0ABN6EK26_9BACT|nr:MULTISPECIES: FMN-binding protein [Prevotella]MDN5553242.1 FMN-binding protein [Prevotella sp.]BCS84418.1 FMN_bind domain-containing protein [Prevotella herbatica]